MSAATDPHPAPGTDANRWHAAAAVAAWIMPGLGHFLLGQRARGLILFVTIGGLWLAGFLIGGISTFDRSRMTESIVQIFQIFTAPSWIASYAYTHIAPGGYPSPGPDAAFIPSFGRTNEQAILYTAIAGMLNFLTVIDALYRDPTDPRHRHVAPTAGEATA